MPGSQVFLGYSDSDADRCSLHSISTLEREFRNSLPEDFVEYLRKYPFQSRRVMTTVIESDGTAHRQPIHSRTSLGKQRTDRSSSKELCKDTPPSPKSYRENLIYAPSHFRAVSF